MNMGCFHLLTTVNNTAVNMDIQISVESLLSVFEYVSRSEITVTS